jgi:hypothetical protein
VTDRARRRPDVADGDSATDINGDPRPRRRPIAFGLHQLFEYLVAVALVVLSVHIGHSQLLLIGGSALGLLALTARGPLGIIRLCGPRFHAALDINAAGIVAVELAALAWLRVAVLTRYPGTAAGTTVDDRSPSPPSPPSSPPTEETTVGGTPPAQLLRVAHRLGRSAATARRRLPEAQPTLEAGARRMGEQAGRLRRSWRRTIR